MEIIKNKSNTTKLHVLVISFVLFFIFLFRINLGIDLSDAGYSLSRFHFFKGEGLDSNFYLSNLVGHLLFKIDNKVIFIRMCSFAIYCLTSIISFYYWARMMKENIIPTLSAIISVLFAIYFPLEVIHNPITSLFMLLIIISLTRFHMQNKKYYLLLCVLLAFVSTLFRVSNVFFLLSIFVYVFIYKPDALLTFAGTFITLLFLSICYIYIFDEYKNVVEIFKFLFFLLTKETNHNLVLLLLRIGKELMVISFGILVISFIRNEKINSKLKNITLFVLSILLAYLCVHFYDINLQSILSNSYRIFIIFLFYSFFDFYRNKQYENEFRSIVSINILLLIALIFGTSNLIHYFKIGLFSVLPVLILFIRSLLRRKEFMLFSCAVSSVLICASMFFIFPYREESIFNLRHETNIPTLEGIKTSEDKAKSLNAVYKKLKQIDWESSRLITDGSIPLFNYVADALPIHDSTWPDLSSYSLQKYIEDIENSNKDIVIIDNKVPTIKNYWKYDKHYNRVLTDKEIVLKKEIEKRNLVIIFSDKYFVIWN